MNEFIERDSPEMMELSEVRSFAEGLSKRAGEMIMAGRDKAQSREYKSRTDYRITLDREVNEYLNAEIARKYPGHNIYSEELPAVIHESGYSWINDPLDGTFNWENDIIPLFTNSLGFAKGRDVTVGAVTMPATGEHFSAQKGMGAYLNGKKISVSNETEIRKAMIAMDFGKVNRQRGVRHLERLLADDGVKYPVVYASTSAAIMQVAKGKLQAYISLGAEPWDYAGSVVIAREAGARVTNIDGKEWELGDDSAIIAHPKLHEQFLAKFADLKTAA
jgi:myo-inositol-1(or 4)-monophosphatase